MYGRQPTPHVVAGAAALTGRGTLMPTACVTTVVLTASTV